jgi:hypothetical protein
VEGSVVAHFLVLSQKRLEELQEITKTYSTQLVFRLRLKPWTNKIQRRYSKNGAVTTVYKFMKWSP